ncbi:hypothetical protein [Kitasatospora sp. NPDC047058]|uniref:hypothetical protein n=1 Tax=Kitasatospora sp. NPDC047058 TaxID=3155620 RepID=UPI0033C4AE1B
MSAVGSYVTVNDPEDPYYGETGKIVWKQKDGTYLVDGVRSKFFEAIIGAGWPAYRPDQLAPAAAPQKG